MTKDERTIKRLKKRLKEVTQAFYEVNTSGLELNQIINLNRPKRLKTDSVLQFE